MDTTLLNKKTIVKLGSKMNNMGCKPSNFALKQMEKMGWKEGQGLGKTASGMVKHITVIKREENVGLGSDALEIVSVPENWWHDAYSSNLKSIKSKIGSKSSRKDKSHCKSDNIQHPPSYEELFKATGGARLGMRARADQTGKHKRTESIQSDVNFACDSVNVTYDSNSEKVPQKSHKKTEKR